MQSFPSSIKNDGRAAFNQQSNISKNYKEAKQTYAPKYSKVPLVHNDRFLNQGISSKNTNISNSQNHDKYEQIYTFKRKEYDFHKQQTSNTNNKKNLRRPSSAMSYNNTNVARNREENEETPICDFNIESFLNSIQIESETNEENPIKPKKIKKKSKTRPTSPRDSYIFFQLLPQQFEKEKPKKKENNNTSISSNSINYNHLNGQEVYSNPPNLEKFSTRLSKKSRKDAVLQRAILAKYSQNQIEYIGLNKEKKKTVSSEQLNKTFLSNDSSIQSNESNSDNSSFKANNDDSVEFKFNSTTSTSPDSSRNQQQNQGINDKNKQIIPKNEDKFSHLNCRMTSLVNYNDLTKIQSKYNKKIKKTNKSNDKNQSTDDTQKQQKNNTIPTRLFFSRTPLFDDPENPKQRETQSIITNRQVSKSLPREKPTSRSYANDSSVKKNINYSDQNGLTPHLVTNKQSIGPTPQLKDTDLQSLPMLNSPHQRASTTISNKPPQLLLSTPHSKSNHNSARKYNENSLFGVNNKDTNDISTKKSSKPPIIPNSKYNFNNKLKYKDIAEIDINNANDSPNSSSSNVNTSEFSQNSSRSNYSSELAPIARARIPRKHSNPQFSIYTKQMKNLNQMSDNPGSDFDDLSKDDNLIAVPRSRRSKNRNSHRSLIISGKDSFFAALAKIHNIGDSTSPPTPKSTNSLNEKQNNMGIFKLNPILPTKKPKEEKSEEPEEIDKVEKTKPVDSITFQLTALEKFKKDKKRKQLEEKGIYRYRKETNQNKSQKDENEKENEIKATESHDEEENQNEIDDNENEMNPIEMDPIQDHSSVTKKLSSNNESESPMISDTESASDNGENENEDEKE